LGDTTPIRQRFDYQSGPSRITKVFDPRDPARVLSSYSWDSNGNLISAKDALGDETHYTPSEFGPPAVAVRPGSRSTMTWDAETGTLRSATIDADAEAPVTVVTEHDAAGRPTVRTMPLGDKQTSIWNGAVLESSVRNADGLQDAVQYSYDDNHWVKSYSNGRFRVDQARDLFGRVIRTISTALDNSASPSVTCSHLGFDGRVLEEVLPDGARVKPIYDGEGRIVSIAKGFLPYSRGLWDDMCPRRSDDVDPADIGRSYELARVNYDEGGRPRFVIDSFGAETRFEYDGFGRTVIVRDEADRSTRFGYDATGRVSGGPPTARRARQWRTSGRRPGMQG
jgi:YD repeat-containing protein